MKNFALYLRTIIFGINDSLVSTVGFLTGIIYALVEAFSMAMGDFLSEESAEEYISKSNVNDRPSVIAAVLMFISCVLASLIPLVPYIIFTSGTALIVSICLSVLSLFIVCMIGARFSRLPMLWRGIRMAFLGGAAIAMG